MELNKIYKMDCLEGLKLLKDASVDFCITSPPYNKKLKKGVVAVKSGYDVFDDDSEENEYQENQIKLLNELARVIKPEGSIFYNHKNRYIDSKFISPLSWILKSELVVRQEIVWNRKLAANLRGWRFWNIDERIYWLQKRETKPREIRCEVASKGSVWEIMPNRGNGHPCSFPEELVERCLQVSQEENLVVLDPYMGSGTVAVVARKKGFDFIGFEISERYINLANERLNGTIFVAGKKEEFLQQDFF